MTEEEKTHGEKLDVLIENDLKEWFKDLMEDETADVQGKIRIGRPFNAAINQLKVCVQVLKEYE